ncbi:hypothetical protein TMatcc_007517 [Talaromyces marneffei ATCC 18224]
MLSKKVFCCAGLTVLSFENASPTRPLELVSCTNDVETLLASSTAWFWTVAPPMSTVSVPTVPDAPDPSPHKLNVTVGRDGSNRSIFGSVRRGCRVRSATRVLLYSLKVESIKTKVCRSDVEFAVRFSQRCGAMRDVICATNTGNLKGSALEIWFWCCGRAENGRCD